MRRTLIGLLLTMALMMAATTPVAAQTPPADVSPEDFVTQQYLDFLARPPDAAGLAFWSARLRAGVDPAALIETMVGSPEFSNAVAPMVRLYYAHLRRAPDLAGLSFWAGRIGAGWTVNDVSNFFAQSAEFEATYGTLSDEQYVDLVYNNVLNRGPDAEGRAFWVSRLAAGASRGEVMALFSESPEFKSATDGLVRATMLYVGMLRRTPEPEGLAFWAGRIDAGVPYRTVMAGFLYGPEYAGRLSTLFPGRHPLTLMATTQPRAVPALAVKIDNVERARPQTGINEADIVIEEVVEGNLTRLIAIFHSRQPAVVGPVRSIRTTDFDVLTALNSPLLAASGANANVLAGLGNTPIINVNAIEAGGAYYRDGSRPAPHNLFARPADLRAFAGTRGGIPAQQFLYRNAGAAVPGTPVAGVDLNYRLTMTYRWNGVGWIRTQNGSTHVDSAGVAVAPNNVVVLITPYRQSPADPESPEAITLGSGQAMVFTAGKMIEGTWERASATSRFTLTDTSGAPIRLTTGTTWVALAPPGTVTVR